MLSKRGNHDKRKGTTRLAAIRVEEIDDSLEVATLIFIDFLSGSVTTLHLGRPR